MSKGAETQYDSPPKLEFTTNGLSTHSLAHLKHFSYVVMSSQGEEIFLDMFEDEYRSMTVSLPPLSHLFFFLPDK